jgi:hypothetical protein
MTDQVRELSFHAAHDPFGRTAPLVERASFPVLGVPLEVRSNAPSAIALAESAFGPWRRLDPSLIEPRSRRPPARLDIVVHEAGDDAPPPASLVLRRHGPVFAAGAGANLFVTVLDRRHAVAFVTPSALADAAWADWHVLAWGRFAVSLIDRVPIHTAAVVGRRRAVLLAGPSGAGKSTLCYAGASAGLGVLSDEVVHVSLERGLRLWGLSPAVPLDPAASRWFPELHALTPVVRANGKRRVMAPLPGSAGPPRLTHGGTLVTCRIERSRSEDYGVVRMDDAETGDLFTLEPGFDQMPEARPAAVAALLAQPTFVLRSGGDPTRAAAVVARLADAEIVDDALA